MNETRIDNFFVIVALGFLVVLISPNFSFLWAENMENLQPTGPQTSGGFFQAAGTLFIKALKFGFSFAVGGIALFAWNLGISANDILFGLPLHKQICVITWPEDLTASNTKAINVSFKTLKGKPIEKPGSQSRLTAVVIRDSLVPVEGTTIIDAQDGLTLSIIFNARMAGLYTVTLRSDGLTVRGFPTTKRVVAGEPSPESTTFVGVQSHTLVLTTGVHDTIKLEPKDNFGNPVSPFELAELSSRFVVSVSRISDQAEIGSDRTLVYRDPNSSEGDLCLSFAFSDGEKGWYKARVSLDGTAIGSPPLTLLVLDLSERSKVDGFLHANRFADLGHTNYFEGNIVSIGGQTSPKPRVAYFYLNSKQLVIKEYFWRIIPRRLSTYRISPATKIKFLRYEDGQPVLSIKDSFQNQYDVRLSDGNILAACFHMILLRKIGGSESFSDKQVFFYIQLAQFHRTRNHRHSRLNIKIDRTNIVESSVKATRSLSDSDWCQLFCVQFLGEEGNDQGGLRREFFEVLSKQLFSPEFGLFVPAEEGGEAVLPNPVPNPKALKLNLFKFAGRVVGKCLYESAQGQAYRQHLPVRLAKSFLAQLVGLRVHYRHFSYDAPEYFSTKIRMIENTQLDGQDNGLEDLTFSEEEFDPANRSIVRTVNLKPNGSTIHVTDQNKLEYLDLLAQYRLCIRIKEQTEQFLEGLQTLVPDNLLALFDENELELLICGVRDYKLAELKDNHTLVGNGVSSRTLSWFWISLEHFTQEQFAKLMQFTTGSSQLPTGGFINLRPLFQIASSGTYENLPTAHTCFNMICLPEHSSFASFEKALLTAITEGSEGFAFA